MSRLTLVTAFAFLFIAAPVVNAQEESVSVVTTPTTVVSTPAPTMTRASIALTQAADRKNIMLTQAASRKETAASNAAERKGKAEESRIEALRMRATREIQNRITAMQKLITRIGSLKKLSDSQKTSLTSQVQSEITSLTALNSKIAADTDLATLQVDVKSIVASYRIYALFIPKIYILTAAEDTLTATEKMTTAYNELKTRVDTAKTNGNDITAMSALLVTMLSDITDSSTQANAAITLVSPLTPDGYPGNTTSLNNARTDLNTARKDLTDARQQGMAVLRQLRTLPMPSLSPTVTTTQPTTSVSAVPTL